MPTGYIATCTPRSQTINIRERPSTSAKIVGVLPYRLTLPVCVVGHEWLRVEYGGVEAYIARHVVVLEMDTP